MSFINKIPSYKRKVLMILGKLFENICYFFFPHKIIANRVIFESEGPYDNGYQLFRYALENRKDLEPYFATEFKMKNIIPEKYRNRVLFFGKGRPWKDKLNYIKKINTFSVIISTYGQYGVSLSKTNKVYIGHGIGIKGAVQFFTTTIKNFDHVILPTPFVVNAFVKAYQMNENKADILPYPRKSLLRVNLNQKKNFLQLIDLKKNEKIVMAMITFRRKENGVFDKSKILTIDVDFEHLNDTLVINNCKLVVKLHPALDNADLSSYPQLPNIVFLRNVQLLSIGLDPTSAMVLADALISDYSSAATDFMILDRPLGYLVPDLEKYKNETNGGFVYENPEDLMPGDKFVDQEGMESFLGKVANNIDEYALERKMVSSLLNGEYPEDIIPEKIILDKYMGAEVTEREMVC